MTVRFAGIVLASASPRRRELLEQIGVQYRVMEHTVDEVVRRRESAGTYVQRLAREKAQSVQACGEDQQPVLGADTIVMCDGQILGKPASKADAMRMWALLSGREHQVLSAVALCHEDECEVRLSTTKVRFKPLSAFECERYWLSGEPEGKAGAYAIQGAGALFVSKISGSYSGVVGLPLMETAELLQLFGVRTSLSAPSGVLK